MPEVIADLGSEKTMQLFQTIVSELKRNSLYSDDVLPEYVVLLLANRHPKEKIKADLDGLLEPHVAAAFTDWLFEEVERLKAPPSFAPIVPVAVSQHHQPPHEHQQAPAILHAAAPVQQMPADVRNVEMSDAPNRVPGGRKFSSAMREVTSVPIPERIVRRRDPVHPVPEDGFRTRRNRSRSPQPMDRDSGPRRSVRHGRSDEERRVVSKADDGSFRIQVKDAREIISSSSRRPAAGRSPERRGPPPARRGRGRSIEMDIVPAAPETSPLNTSAETLPAPEPRVKCQYYPNCERENCPFYHPKRICTYFPNCSRGAECTFVHPQIPCKFQGTCQNPLCNYYHDPAHVPAAPIAHVPVAGPQISTVLCKFHPHCVNAFCPFVHPIETPCKYGENCQRPGCHFKHPPGYKLAPKVKVFAPCMFGPRCTKAGCIYQHPEAPTDMAIDQAPAQTEAQPAVSAFPVVELQQQQQ